MTSQWQKGPHDLSCYVHMFAVHYKLYMYYTMYKMGKISCQYRKICDFSYNVKSYTKLKALKTFVFVKDLVLEEFDLKDLHILFLDLKIWP